MKITLEPTEQGKPQQPTVVVSVPDDDLTVSEAMEICKQALMAFGYSPDTVKEYFA